MNEKFKELRKKAEDSVRQEHGYPTNALLPEEWVDSKFAELIVRECAQAIDKVYEDAEPDHGCYDWATWAEGSDILKHFGVK
jgi:hypothetical protein